MNIAADTCVYTNHNITLETIPVELKENWDGPSADAKPAKKGTSEA